MLTFGSTPSALRPSTSNARNFRTLVAVVKASREDADLSRQEFAKRLGLTYSQAVNMEHGRRAISFVDFVLLASDIGKDPVELLERVSAW